MNSLYKLKYLFIVVILLIGCQKKQIIDNGTEPITTNKNIVPAGFFIENRKVPGVVTGSKILNQETTSANSTTSSNPDPDNGDEPIILGQQLSNPYTIANMQAAVNILLWWKLSNYCFAPVC